jgi:hypothetical protein
MLTHKICRIQSKTELILGVSSLRVLPQSLPSEPLRGVKGNVAALHVTKACKKCRGTTPLVLNLGTRRRWVVNFMPRSAIPPVSTEQGGPGYRSRYSDSLRTGRPGDRMPVEARFSAHVQAGLGAHPSYYKMGTASYPGVRRPGRGVDHPPHLAPRLKKEYSYTSTLPLGLRGLL